MATVQDLQRQKDEAERVVKNKKIELVRQQIIDLDKQIVTLQQQRTAAQSDLSRLSAS